MFFKPLLCLCTFMGFGERFAVRVRSYAFKVSLLLLASLKSPILTLRKLLLKTSKAPHRCTTVLHACHCIENEFLSHLTPNSATLCQKKRQVQNKMVEVKK